MAGRYKYGFKDKLVSQATGGLSNYIMSAGDFFRGWVGLGEDKTFAEHLKETNLQEQLYAEEHPWRAGVAQTIGGRLNPIQTAAKTLSGAKDLVVRGKEYQGYPEDVVDKKSLAKMRKTLKTAAELGEPQMHWYGDSGEAIVEAALGDMPRAKKLGNYLAISSPGANVGVNTGFGTGFYYQDLVGDELSSGRRPAEMGKSAKRYSEEGEGYIGPKRDPFFNDIMGEVDPSLPQDTVTADMWMSRLFGMKSDALLTTETRVIIKEVQRVAKKLGIKPRQAQAAMWSLIKGKWEFVAKGVKAKGEKMGWDEAELRTQLRKAALKANIPPQVLESAGYSFKEGLEAQTGAIGVEAIPSMKSNLLPWIHKAPMQVKKDFTDKIFEAVGETVARAVGMLRTPSKDVEGIGSYEEDGETSYNPSKQVGLVIPVGKGGQPTGKMHPSARKAVEVYAAITGQVIHQDSVGYGKGFKAVKRDPDDMTGAERKKYTVKQGGKTINNATKLDFSNQYQLDIGREMTDTEKKNLMEVVGNHPDLQVTDKDGSVFSGVWFAPAKDGITINSFGDDTNATEKFINSLPNVKFIKTLLGILKDKTLLPGVRAEGAPVTHDGDLIGGDSVGKSYRNVIRENRAEAKERAVSASVSPRVEKVYRDFAREQGQPDPFPDRFSGPSVEIPRSLNRQFPLRKGVADYGARLSEGDRYVDRYGLPQSWRVRK